MLWVLSSTLAKSKTQKTKKTRSTDSKIWYNQKSLKKHLSQKS